MTPASSPTLAPFAAGLAVIVLQGTVLTKLGGLNFIVAVVVYIASGARFLPGALAVFLLGLIQGLFSGSVMGVEAVVFLFIYFLSYIIDLRFNIRHPAHHLLLILAALFFHRLVLLLASPYFSWPHLFEPSLVVSALFSPLLFRCFELLDRLQVRIFNPKPSSS